MVCSSTGCWNFTRVAVIYILVLRFLIARTLLIYTCSTNKNANRKMVYLGPAYHWHNSRQCTQYLFEKVQPFGFLNLHIWKKAFQVCIRVVIDDEHENRIEKHAWADNEYYNYLDSQKFFWLGWSCQECNTTTKSLNLQLHCMRNDRNFYV